MQVSALYIYPIKSCGGLARGMMEIGKNGPVNDREWMIVDESGTFLTQRELPPMALIQPSLTAKHLIITAPNMGEIAVSMAEDDAAPARPVTVWRDTVLAADAGDEVATYLSDYLKQPVRMVRMPSKVVRRVDMTYARSEAQTGFADGFPILVISEASLAELNRRLVARSQDEVSMRRFRPNIVVSDVGAPFAEDAWYAFTIGGVSFDVVKPCARCKITTVDPATGEVLVPKEPLATLATFRNSERGVLFGQNVVHRGAGMLSVGDAVVAEKQPA